MSLVHVWEGDAKFFLRKISCKRFATDVISFPPVATEQQVPLRARRPEQHNGTNDRQLRQYICHGSEEQHMATRRVVGEEHHLQRLQSGCECLRFPQGPHIRQATRRPENLYQ